MPKITHEKDQNTLVIVEGSTSYTINKQTGVVSILSNDALNFPGFYNRIEDELFLSIDYPYVFCTTGLCTLSSLLEIRLVDFSNHTSSLIYQSEEIRGTSVSGRYVGENFYRGSGSVATVIPVLEHPFLLIIICFLIVLITQRKYFIKSHTKY